MTAIKFCGMTRRPDVAAAVALGVDALGFVFWPRSPRHIGLGQAAALIGTLPPAVRPVGVFVSPSSDEVRRAVDAGVRVVQVHGDATAAVEREDVEVWVAATLEGNELSRPVPDACTVLLDAHDPVRHGGTGRTIDWAGAARVAATRRVMLAGGLSAGNVAAAVRMVRPYGVDVASGIEDAPGIKSVSAMRAFVAAVREAER